MKNKSRETSLQYEKHELDPLVQISVNMPDFHQPDLAGNSTSSNSAEWFDNYFVVLEFCIARQRVKYNYLVWGVCHMPSIGAGKGRETAWHIEEIGIRVIGWLIDLFVLVCIHATRPSYDLSLCRKQ